jgi:hypothetical protein
MGPDFEEAVHILVVGSGSSGCAAALAKLGLTLAKGMIFAYVAAKQLRVRPV